MTRIATYGQQIGLLEQTLRRQSDAGRSQMQVSTGKKAQDYGGYGIESGALISAHAIKSRNESYQSTVKQLGLRFDQVDIQLRAVGDSSKQFKQAILDVLALDDATTLGTSMEQNFKALLGNVNAQFDGKYLFGGAHINSKPVTISDLAGLMAAPSVAGVFDVDGSKATARVADGQDMEHGILADDFAASIFQVFRDIQAYAEDPLTGPLDGTMTAAQRTFLEAKLMELQVGIDKVEQYEQENGVRQQQLSSLGALHEERANSLGQLISDIEDVDITEAISRLQNDQTALQASYRVLSQVNKLTLNDFL